MNNDTFQLGGMAIVALTLCLVWFVLGPACVWCINEAAAALLSARVG